MRYILERIHVEIGILKAGTDRETDRERERSGVASKQLEAERKKLFLSTRMILLIHSTAIIE